METSVTLFAPVSSRDREPLSLAAPACSGARACRSRSAGAVATRAAAQSADPQELARVSPRGQLPRRRHRRRRARRRPRPRPISARRCGPTRTTTNCSTALSVASGRRAMSTRPCGSPSASLQDDKNDRIARLVLGVRAIKQKQYPDRAQHLSAAVRGPIDRSHRDAAYRLGAIRRRRRRRAIETHRPAEGRRTGTRCSTTIMPA